jgi:hypothetical protein
VHVFSKALANHEKGIKHALHATLAGWKPGRSHAMVHASEATREGDRQFCIREYALKDLEPQRPPQEYLTTSQVLTFRIGHLVQDQIVHWLSDAGTAITNWRCLVCKCLYERCKRPTRCGHCSCAEFKPEEIRLQSTVSGIGGGFDVLCLSAGQLQITEIKTMDPEAFKKLMAPLAEHRLRTNLYLRVAAESDDPWKDRLDLTRARILYVSKGGFGTLDTTLGAQGLKEKFSPFKEFVIGRDDAATQAIHERAVRLKQFRAGNAGVPTGVCTTAFTKRAQLCRMTASCFGGKYPPADQGGS